MICQQYSIGIVLILAAVLRAHSEKASGLYVDNGFDQTVVHQIATHREKREMEYELLDLFGLSDRPKRIARRALIVKRSAPTFLLNIYQSVLSEDGDNSIKQQYENAEKFYLSGQDISVIDQSDVIMTFGAHNPHSGNASKINRGKRIWFDVSEVPQSEHIIAAELRLYQNMDMTTFNPVEDYTVAIYRVARSQEGSRIKHYLDSANTTVTRDGWITLNIKEALQHWVDYPKENRGLFLAVHRINYTGHVLRPDDIGIVGVFGIPDKQPFMVGFFKTSAMRGTLIKQKENKPRKRRGSSSPNVASNPYIDSMNRRRVKSCNMHSLYVSFKDLQWQDWIIAPEGYNAYYCSGECNFPLNTHMNATNHAIVQTLVHLMKPEKVPKPCCAPTKLSSISVLYFLDDSNVVLKKYKSMVVNSCGCH